MRWRRARRGRRLAKLSTGTELYSVAMFLGHGAVQLTAGARSGRTGIAGLAARASERAMFIPNNDDRTGQHDRVFRLVTGFSPGLPAAPVLSSLLGVSYVPRH